MVADGDATPAGAVGVGDIAVGVEAVGHLGGQALELVGAVFFAEAGQVGFGFVAEGQADEAGQLLKEGADHPDARC